MNKIISFFLALFLTAVLASQKEASPEQKAQMDKQMEALQKFLMEAEAGGKADKPMMIKHVDGKMVMEEIPADIMANFQFPDMDKDDI